MSDLKAEMTLGLNTEGITDGVKSVNSNLENAKDSAEELAGALDFKESGVKTLSKNLDGVSDSLEDVKKSADSAGKSIDKMSDTKKIGILQMAISRVASGFTQAIGFDSLEAVKASFIGAIGLGLEFMQQSEEGQKRVQKWQEKIGEMKARIGELFATAMEKMEPFIDWAMDTINNWVIPGVRECAKFIYSMYDTYLEPFFKKIGEGWDTYGVPVVAGFMTAWTNGFEVVKLGLNQWLLSYVKTFETVKYWLTDEIPGSIAWFADLVINNFTTIGENIKTIFSNVGTNISGFFSAIKDVATGKGWTFQSTSVSSGVKELDAPKYSDYVQGREKSTLEKTLEKNIETLSKDIRDGYDKNLAYLRSDVTPFVKQTADATEETAENVETVADNQMTQIKMENEDKYIGGGADQQQDGGDKVEGAKSSLEDLVGAYNRIQMATTSITPEEQELINIRKQNWAIHMENMRLSKEQHREMTRMLAQGTQREAVVAGG